MRVIRASKMIESVKKYNALSIEIKKLETIKKELRTQLLELHEVKQDDQLRCESLLVNFKKSVRKIFDKKTYLKDNGDDALNDYLKESESITITIKSVA